MAVSESMNSDFHKSLSNVNDQVVEFANKHYDNQRQYDLTVIIAFYNNINVLKLTLASLEMQSHKNFAVVVCDDGSKSEVVSTLKQHLNELSFPILHLWHQDIGFRKNRMLNWGILKSPSDYLAFIDQDCILHPEFLKEHLTHRKTKTVLSGRRTDLTPFVSRQLTPEKIKLGYLQKNFWWIFLAILWMKDNNAPKGIYIKNNWLRNLVNRKHRGIVGCHFSVHKQDLLDINGFDTRYEGAGIGEDSDIDYRMSLNGVKIQPFCNIAIQYHFYHKLLIRKNVNHEIFAEVQRERQIVTQYGIQQQLAQLIK